MIAILCDKIAGLVIDIIGDFATLPRHAKGRRIAAVGGAVVVSAGPICRTTNIDYFIVDVRLLPSARAK